MRRPRARTVGIVGVCLALLAALAVGVNEYRWRGSVTLLANWGGQNEKDLQDRVIRRFEKKYRIHVIYQGSSAESQVLAADVETGTPPDVVILPGPGELADYASRGRLKSLGKLVSSDDFGATWMPLVKGPDGRKRPYWVPVRADLKSMVWHPASLPASRLTAAAAAPGAWCLGMGSGATSGWPATDWLEDILLQQAGPEVYKRWATGSLSWHDAQLEKAWTTWGDMVGAGTAHIGRALITDFDKASAQVAATPASCRLEHQASFVRHQKPWRTAGATYAPSAAVIPDARRNADAWEVSGDLAAMLRNTPQARQLIRYLASADVQRTWNTTESGFSAKKEVLRTAYRGDPTAERIARTLRDPGAAQCWDASDAMPPPMRDAFSQAALRFLATGDLGAQLDSLEAVRTRPGATSPAFDVCGPA
jgi:alpha-glucoside transport system substrate-binding protein